MAHRSAMVSSIGVMAGSAGAVVPGVVPGSRSARHGAVRAGDPPWDSAPAAHSASRRPRPKQPNAPAVARASSAAVGSGTRRTRSSRLSYGRPAASRSAPSLPRLRTYSRPSRIAGCGSPGECGASPAGVYGSSSVACGRARVDVHAEHAYAVPPRVADQGLRAVEAHRLVAQQRRGERRRIVPLEVRAGVHEMGEALRVRLGEAEAGEAEDLGRTPPRRSRRRCRARPCRPAAARGAVRCARARAWRSSPAAARRTPPG